MSILQLKNLKTNQNISARYACKVHSSFFHLHLLPSAPFPSSNNFTSPEPSRINNSTTILLKISFLYMQIIVKAMTKRSSAKSPEPAFTILLSVSLLHVVIFLIPTTALLANRQQSPEISQIKSLRHQKAIQFRVSHTVNSIFNIQFSKLYLHLPCIVSYKRLCSL